VDEGDEPRHLKAGHIKPWRDANDAERRRRMNAGRTPLSPHIDHPFFDDGWHHLLTTKNSSSFLM
jgi:hypothetical protein